MMESFIIAAFRSRQSVLRFDTQLRQIGIASSVISTPREVSMGCGLSVSFPQQHLHQAITEYERARPVGLIGFYLVQPMQGSRSTLTPVYAPKPGL